MNSTYNKWNRADDGTYIYRPNNQEILDALTPVSYFKQLTNLIKKAIFLYGQFGCCLAKGVWNTTIRINNYVQKIVEYVKTTSSNVFNTYWKAANGMDIRRNAV
jgi:hypothetical protein